jgi:hypothetical protein
MLYTRLKLEEKRATQLRSEIYCEKLRVKAETPILATYDGFIKTLADQSNDKAYRPELRRVFAALLEQIVLDPHLKDGVWRYTVHLKGVGEGIEIVCKAKPESWCHRALGRRTMGS